MKKRKLNKMNLVKFSLGLLVCLVVIYFLFANFISNENNVIYEGGMLNTNISNVCTDCNVILISVDTLGANHMGGLFGDENNTPFVDGLAKNNIAFTRAISQSSWTLPAHISMLTGKYSYELNVVDFDDKFSDDVLTMAEVFKKYNYSTQAFSNGGFVQPQYGFDQGFDNFNGSPKLKDWDDIPNILNESLDYALENKDNKFFLFIRPFHLHDPYVPQDIRLNEYHINDIVNFNFQKIKDIETIDNMHKSYDAQVGEFDESFKKFYLELERYGILNNTIIIITSDHGEAFGEHGLYAYHATNLYTELIHVPLIFILPENKKIVINNVVETRSIPATIVDLLGFETEPSFDNISIYPLFDGINKSFIAQSLTVKDYTALLVAETGYLIFDALGGDFLPTKKYEISLEKRTVSVFSDKWHLISNFNRSYELYNINSDFGERNNLIKDASELPKKDREEINFMIEQLYSIR